MSDEDNGRQEEAETVLVNNMDEQDIWCRDGQMQMVQSHSPCFYRLQVLQVTDI